VDDCNAAASKEKRNVSLYLSKKARGVVHVSSLEVLKVSVL
jgi:hypothetical protein